MKKIIKLTENDLVRLTKTIINETKKEKSDFSASNSNDLEIIENKIIKCLNDADNKLDADDFSRLAESIIDYIDEIGRSKR